MIALKSKVFVPVIAAVLVILVGGGAFVAQKHMAEQKIAMQKKLAQEEREKAAQAYEDVLNGFVQDVAAEMKAYKTQRGVLREIIKPHNFENMEYAKQNYEEFKNRIAPSLRQQGQRVLNVFDLSGAKLDQILDGKPEDTRTALSTKWGQMREAEYSRYDQFFKAEDKVLEAYEELLRYYFVKSNSYKIVNEGFVFDKVEDQKSAQDLLKIIEDLQAKPEKNAPSEVGNASQESDAQAIPEEVPTVEQPVSAPTAPAEESAPAAP